MPQTYNLNSGDGGGEELVGPRSLLDRICVLEVQ